MAAAVGELTGFEYFGFDGPCSEPSQTIAALDGAEFVTYSGAPADIPCGRLTVASETACTQPDRQSTPIDENVRNYVYADLNAPMYQSLSCCSSKARFGFAYDTAGTPQSADIHDPFSRSALQVK